LAKVAAAFFGRIRSLNDSKKELEELEKKTECFRIANYLANKLPYIRSTPPITFVQNIYRARFPEKPVIR